MYMCVCEIHTSVLILSWSNFPVWPNFLRKSRDGSVADDNETLLLVVVVDGAGDVVVAVGINVLSKLFALVSSNFSAKFKALAL